VELRLYRRIIEIRDAQLALINHVPAETRDTIRTALRARNRDTESAIDACMLRLALHLKTGARTAADPRQTLSWYGDATLDGESAYLLAVAHQMRRPEIVAAASTALDQPAGRPPTG
jgi:hypothetical protein